MSEKKVELKVSATSFPDINASTQVKESEAYGLQVARAIEGEWFRRAGNSCRYYDQYAEFHRRRLYARGEQAIGKYKNLLAVDGDLSYMNINWDIVKIAPKFVDIVANGMADRLYKVRATAQDAMSAEKKNLFQDMIEADMVAKDFLTMTKEQFGVDAFNVDPKDLPQTDDELALYMELRYKPSIEIAEEIAIDNIFEMNDFQVVQRRCDLDQITLGLSFTKHEFSKNEGLLVKYVDPAAMVWSETEEPDFSDCFYFGEIKNVHYTELRKIDPTITDEQLKEIQQFGSAWYNNYSIVRQYYDSAFLNETVTLLYFNYKTEKKFVYKEKITKQGGKKVIAKNDSFVNAESENFRVVEIPKEVWYEGILVAGSNHLLKWNMMKNMVRPKSPSQKALPNYIGYAPHMYMGRFDSLVNRMVPFLDNIQLIHIKLQQIQARMVPDGVFIDADGLNDIDLGKGANYNPEEALKLYFQTGSVIGRSYTQDGEFNNARVPIQELQSNSGFNKIQALITAYNQNLNMLRDATGLNEARDGSMPKADALVGVQKLAALNSNTATRHVLDGRLLMVRRLAQALSLRMADILEYADFKEQFAMQIGKYNLAILEDVKNLYLHDFGIYVDLLPDEHEKEMLEANIQVSLQRDQIDLEDAIDIRNVKNIKLANELLKMKRRRKLEDLRAREDQQQQMQAQINMQSQQMAAQAKMEQAQMEAQSKISIKEAETNFEMQKMQFEVEKKKELMALEFQYNMELKGIETDGLMKRENEKEKAKDKRVDLQATRQSELIEQRQKGLPAKNFESSGNDIISGGGGAFDLETFMPK
jgi:hypothetical protein